MTVAAQLLFWGAAAAESAVDTDRLFSFNAGSDTGVAGQKEIQGSVVGGFGRGSGSYAALATETTLQYSPAQNFQLAFSADADAHRIENVPGMNNLRSLAFAALGAGFGYRLLDRAAQGSGVTFYANADWKRVDEDTGANSLGYGGEFTVAIDREVLADRMVAVFNVVYQLAAERSLDLPAWAWDTTIGLRAGFSVKLTETLFGGLEAQYLRKNDGFDFRPPLGDAFFFGPSMSLNLSKHTWISAGWNAQVFGRVSGMDRALDLADFNHHLIRFGMGVEF